MPIVAGGIGSGLDITGLVAQLVAAEAEPANARLNTRELEYSSELTAYGTLKSALSTFQTSIENLEDGDAFQVFKSESSDESVFTATASTAAVSGNYNIEVVQVAEFEKLKTIDFTASTDTVGTGTLDITLGAATFQLTIDSSNSSLQGIRDAINDATDNPGIRASIINVDSGAQLIFTSDEVGSVNTIDIVATDDDGADGFDLARLNTVNLTSLQAASDAIIKVDSQTVTRTTNSFSDVISGITFNLAKADSGTTHTLAVKSDTATIKNSVESFVQNYNALSGVMRGLSNYDETSEIAGPLNGDSVVRGIENSLRAALFTNITNDVYSSLSDLGISIDDSGSLQIDDAELDEALSNNLSDVKQFFSATDGISSVFTAALSGYIDDDGIIDSRTDGLESRLDRVEDRRDQLDRRIETLELRLTKQFNAMDILVSQLRSTGDFLTQQLQNLPTLNNSRR